MRSAITRHLRSFFSGRRPNISEIEIGEVAINFPDKRIYSRNNDNTIVQIGGGSLHSLEGVSGIGGTANQFLQFDGIDSLWKGSTISPVVTVNLTGPIIGTANTTLSNLTSGTVNITTSVTPNSVVLTRDTTGYYVGNVSSNNGVYNNYVAGENSSANFWIGQNVDTTSSVLFNNVTATSNVNAQNARITNNVAVISRITTGSIVGIGSGYNNEQLYTTPGSYTWNIPTGVNKFYIMILGGAGSGGSASSGLLAPRRYGDGGNSGAVCWKTYTRVSGLNSVAIGVGAGGVVTAVNQKANGGQSNVTYNGATMVANGGDSGNHWYENMAETPATFSGADFGLVGTIGNPGGTGGNTGSGNGSPLGYGHPTPVQSGTSAKTGRSGIGYNSPGAGGDTGTNNSSRRGGDGTGGLALIRW